MVLTQRPRADGYRRSNYKVLGYSVIIGIAAMTFGYDQGMTGGLLAMQPFMKDYGCFDHKLGGYTMTANSQTLMYGVELAGIVIAMVLAGAVSTRYGRKCLVYLCTFFAVAGVAVQIVPHYPIMVLGRGIMGLGIGFAANGCLVFWSEIPPAHLRGMIAVFYQVFLNVSNFVGACVNQGTHKMDSAWSYRTGLLVAMLPPLTLLSLLWMVPESPRWLVTKGRTQQAKENMAKIRGSTWAPEDIEEEVREIGFFVELEATLEKSSSYADCLKGTDLRRTMISLLVFVGQQLFGVAFFAGFLTYFFALVGIHDAFLATVISNVCSIAGAVGSWPLVKYCGRRPIMIGGACAQAFCMLAFAIIAKAAPTNPAASKCIIAFISLFQFTYSFTWGAAGNALAVEVLSTRLRSKALSIAGGAGWIMCLAVICGSPFMISPYYGNLGTDIGFIFGSTAVAVMVLTILFVPETKDRTLEEIDEMFLNRVPTRKFRDYVCTGVVGDYSASHAESEKNVASVLEVVEV